MTWKDWSGGRGHAYYQKRKRHGISSSRQDFDMVVVKSFELDHVYDVTGSANDEE